MVGPPQFGPIAMNGSAASRHTSVEWSSQRSSTAVHPFSRITTGRHLARTSSAVSPASLRVSLASVHVLNAKRAVPRLLRFLRPRALCGGGISPSQMLAAVRPVVRRAAVAGGDELVEVGPADTHAATYLVGRERPGVDPVPDCLLSRSATVRNSSSATH